MTEDKCKQLVEMAIACGRKRLSPQTNYIHYCYHALDEETHYPIPIIENALFALALMRSKTMENMNEGKAMLERLLAFQNSDGNFPIYLHDYPEAKDRCLGVHLLPIFYWIQKHFQVVLGSDLKQKLDQANGRLLDYCLKVQQEINLPSHIAIKIAAAAKAYGRSEGDSLLNNIRKDETIWGCPAYLGDYLSALQMIYPSLKDSPWSDLLDHLNNSWHRPSSTFIGPSWKESQQGYEPQVTLYDLYMGVLGDQFSARALVDHPIHLHGAFIQPTIDRIQGNDNRYAQSFIPYDQRPAQNIEKFFHPLKIVWGTPKRSHSFVMQGGNATRIEAGQNGEFLIELGPMVNVEDREVSREVSLYFDVFEGTEITIDGEASNTFKLGQLIHLKYGGVSLKVKFDIVEGEGHFFGHLMRGNRPAQVALKGNHRFKAYDWTLFLRTLRRSEKCRLKVHVEVHED